MGEQDFLTRDEMLVGCDFTTLPSLAEDWCAVHDQSFWQRCVPSKQDAKSRAAARAELAKGSVLLSDADILGISTKVDHLQRKRVLPDERAIADTAAIHAVAVERATTAVANAKAHADAAALRARVDGALADRDALIEALMDIADQKNSPRYATLQGAINRAESALAALTPPAGTTTGRGRADGAPRVTEGKEHE